MSETRPRPFLAVLAEAHLEGRKGVVRAMRGEGRLAAAVSDGRIVALESEGLSGSASSEEDRELAALLADAFTTGQPSVSRAAARQTLIEALRAADTEGSFEEGAAEGADPPLDFAIEEMLREAAYTGDIAAVEAALGPLDQPLEAVADPMAVSQTILTPSEGYLLSRLDGRLTAQAAFDLLPIDADAARRSLFGLLVSGLVRFGKAEPPAPRAPRSAADSASDALKAPHPTAAAEALEVRRATILEAKARIVGQKSHYDVLGLTRDATEAEVKAAYFRLAKQFHPDTLHDLQDLHDTVQAIFARLGTAYEVLHNPKSRAAYEELLPRKRSTPAAPEMPAPRRAPPHVQGAALPPVDTSAASIYERGIFAEDNLRSAEALLGEGKFFDVIQMLESQVDALPDRSRARGRLVLAQAFMHNPKWLHRSEEVLKAAIKEEPGSAEAYYLLGTVYKTGGLMNRAASMFRKALEARPHHKQAAEELAALEKAPPPPRRWFRGS